MGVQINEDRWGVILQSLDVANVTNTNTSSEQDFTVPGLKVGDLVIAQKPTLSAGLVVGNARVSAADTLSITFGNLTGSAVNPAAETWRIFWFRPEKTSASAQT